MHISRTLQKIFSMIHIAVWASGNGTNAENIIDYFKDHPRIKVKLIISNRKDACVLQRAGKHQLATEVIPKSLLQNDKYTMRILEKHAVSWIILAGYLLLIPKYLIQHFPKRILNIHPALLPKFGGKGMFGMHVHEAVISAKEKVSGISIHYVNEVYDNGEIVFQAACPVKALDSAESLAERIHELEYKHYPPVIEKQILLYDEHDES